MDNTVLRGDSARQAIKKGIDLVADTVKITLGPRGRNVVLDTDPYKASPTITNDGVTIAREVNGATREEKIGTKLVKEVANKTNDVAGDGTTTATLLFQSIVGYALQLMANDGDPVSIRKGIEMGAEVVADLVEKERITTKDIKSLTSVATISCSDPTIGKIVAEVVNKVGGEGLITLEDNEAEETEFYISEGLELRGGFQLPAFITNQAKQEVQLDKVPIFVTDHDITNGLEAVKFMEVCSAHGYKHAILIANSISGEAMATAVINKIQGKFNLTPIRVVAFGNQGQEVLRDVAAATSATFYTKDEGHKLPTNANEGYEWDDFGLAGRVVATRDRTTILDGAGDREERIKELEAQLPNLKRAYEKDNVKERIARLRQGVGVIRVGGTTETEKEERRLRVEDAVNATKAALREGIVAGGGAPLYRAAKAARIQGLPDTTGNISVTFGFDAVLRACSDPINQMALNSGLKLDRGDLEKIEKDSKLTIDFTDGRVVDFQKEGIIDPLLVVIAALKNASVSAALFITTEASVVMPEAPEKTE